jgi:hypothetical protein
MNKMTQQYLYRERKNPGWSELQPPRTLKSLDDDEIELIHGFIVVITPRALEVATDATAREIAEIIRLKPLFKLIKYNKTPVITRIEDAIAFQEMLDGFVRNILDVNVDMILTVNVDTKPVDLPFKCEHTTGITRLKMPWNPPLNPPRPDAAAKGAFHLSKYECKILSSLFSRILGQCEFP